MYDDVTAGLLGNPAVPPPAVVVVCPQIVAVRKSSTEVAETEGIKLRKSLMEVVIMAP